VLIGDFTNNVMSGRSGCPVGWIPILRIAVLYARGSRQGPLALVEVKSDNRAQPFW
jgi:hypothetical protein